MTPMRTATHLSITVILAGAMGFAGCDSDVHTQPAAKVATDPTTTTDMEANTGVAQAKAESKAEANADVADVRIVREIKQRLRDDPNVSPIARNCQISCQSGEVFLAGFVVSQDERLLVEEHALQVKGVVKVENHLEVKPPHNP
ncbi:MAG: BON domain-containing protein [Phycisphaerales bacterium]